MATSTMRAFQHILEVCALVFNVSAGLLFAYLGSLGISGNLADTSSRENQEIGLLALFFAGVLILNALAIVRFGSLGIISNLQFGRQSRVDKGLFILALLGNGVCFFIGLYFFWSPELRRLLFGLPIEALLLWCYSTLHILIHSVNFWECGKRADVRPLGK